MPARYCARASNRPSAPYAAGIRLGLPDARIVLDHFHLVLLGNSMVTDVRQRVPAGHPIYVLGRRADITTAGAPLFYVLAGRPNPTRWDIAAPGVMTGAPVQRAIVARLRATRPAALVRWTSPLTAAREPNAAGRSSGVRLLDAYVARAYRPAARYGEWLVLVPRG